MVAAQLKEPPYRYALQEHDQEKGYCGRFIVHVPNHLELRAENWLRGWRAEGRLAGWRDQAVERELKSISDTARKRRIKRHWECVRWLCAGIHPQEKAWDSAARVPRPLYELLGIPKNELRPAGFIEGHRRPSASHALLPGTVRAVSIGMPFLSAFNDGAWGYVTAGWELNEYQNRKAILREHDREEERLKALYSESDEQGLRVQSEMSRLRECWSDEHKHWKRSWQVWWPTPEI